ncbi:MAG: response regulator [Bacteroidetes bacterium]|nr:MAG: response regulator [Bacteroidota bacterium]
MKSIFYISFLTCFFISFDAASQKMHFNYEREKESADSLYELGESQKALEKHYKIIEYLNNHGKKDEEHYLRLIDNQLRVANLHLYINDSIANLYIDKATSHLSKVRDPLRHYQCYNVRFFALFYTPGSEEKLSSLADSCLKYAQIMGDDQSLGESYINKAQVQILKYQKKDALKYALKSESYIQNIDQIPFKGTLNNNLGNVFFDLGSYEKAIQCHLITYEVAKELQDLEILLDACYNLAQDHESSGNFKLATKYYHEFSDSVSSYYEKIIEDRFVEAEAKYNGELKDKEITQQKFLTRQKELERNQTIYLGIIVLMFMLAVFFWLYNRQHRRKKQVELTYQKELELNSLRGSFLENVAHEIRTPITLVGTYIELAKEKLEANHPIQDQLSKALSNSQQVVRNADELLELMRLEHGSIPLRLDWIELQAFSRHLYLSFEPLAQLKRIKLCFENHLSEDLKIYTDKNRVEKIINNLISNAIKYSPSNTEIQFRIKETETSVLLEVCDQGPGINKDEQHKIFDRFYQARTNNKSGGFGIGLAFSKELAQSLKAKLEVRSIPGEGACFFLELVKNAFEPMPYSNATETTLENKTPLIETTKRKILIVEDNPEMNAFLNELFSEEYLCDSAFDGNEALQFVQKNNYSLIISDIMMPGLNGFELKRRINKLEQNRRVPFIFLSAKSRLNDKLEGFELGVDDFISKPFQRQELLARTKALIANKIERDTWSRENPEFGEENSDVEEQLLQKIKSVILKELSNENYKVSDLAQEVAYSQRQLGRFLKHKTGMSPVQFMLEIRLQKAFLCIQQKKFKTISETRNYVGIPSASHFNKKFFERFGIRPTEI